MSSEAGASPAAVGRALIADCSALILAGGASRRMGSDKTQLLLGDHTLLERAIASVAPLFARTLVSVRQYRPEIALPQVCDAYPDAGPLAGICAGLAHVSTRWVFVLGADMPFVQPALIAALSRRRGDCDAVVARVHGHLQPLAAFYSTSARARLQAIVAAGGQRSVRHALAGLNVAIVDAADPTLRSFFDLDTPDDLAAARESAKHQRIFSE